MEPEESCPSQENDCNELDHDEADINFDSDISDWTSEPDPVD